MWSYQEPYYNKAVQIPLFYFFQKKSSIVIHAVETLMLAAQCKIAVNNTIAHILGLDKKGKGKVKQFAKLSYLGQVTIAQLVSKKYISQGLFE